MKHVGPFVFCLLVIGAFSIDGASRRPNVLFIAVDDLRPELACYGKARIHSPHLDRLASEGVLFERAYCQVPVCGASRASLLSGTRPTRDRFVTYDTRVERDYPGYVSIPAHFKRHGYTTISNGKVYHHHDDDAASWDEIWAPQYTNSSGWLDYQTETNLVLNSNPDGRGLPYEKADLPDDAYFDGKIAAKTIDDLRTLAAAGKPFFLAAGFLKPHLPFNAPSRYWDLYSSDDIRLADNPFAPEGAPPQAMHNFAELRSYAGIPRKGPVSDAMARKLIHGYYACVSYTDAQIGRVLEELDRLGLRGNTIVVLWGDHGWHLGEHGLWCKHCSFDRVMRAPLIISGPGLSRGASTKSLVEFIDIFPTLADLAGLPIPERLHGQSLVPILRDPTVRLKEAVYSRWKAGESVITDRYIYTEWLDEKRHINARMLYDLEADPGENINIAERPENADLVARLSALIARGYEMAQIDAQ